MLVRKIGFFTFFLVRSALKGIAWRCMSLPASCKCYGSYQLMQDIIDASCSFVCRIPERYSREVVKGIELSGDAKKAEILSDQIVKFGKGQTDNILKHPLRLIEVKCTERTLKSVRLGRKNNCKETTMLIATNRLDLDADTIALIYHYRWQIEIFFRYFNLQT